LPSTKLFCMNLNKAVPPLGDAKVWSKRHSHTMRMQNEARLATGAHRGHKQQVPALICGS